MKNPIVLELLDSLNNKQQQQFGLFLHSSYFNVPKRLQDAYAFLLRSKYLNQPERLKSELFSALYRGLSFEYC